MPRRWWFYLAVPPVGFVLLMIVFSHLGRDYNDIPRALELQGVTLVTFGLAAVSVLFGWSVGRERTCERCRARWCDRERLGDTKITAECGSKYGRFTADGWQNGTKVTSTNEYEYSCRKCGHKFRRTMRGARRRTDY